MALDDTLTWLARPETQRGSRRTGHVLREFALDAVPMLEPRWQTRALLGQQLTPSFIAAALFILVTAAGILVRSVCVGHFGRRDAEIVRAPRRRSRPSHGAVSW